MYPVSSYALNTNLRRTIKGVVPQPQADDLPINAGRRQRSVIICAIIKLLTEICPQYVIRCYTMLSAVLHPPSLFCPGKWDLKIYNGGVDENVTSTNNFALSFVISPSF